jgi:hypothetical protein
MRPTSTLTPTPMRPTPTRPFRFASRPNRDRRLVVSLTADEWDELKDDADAMRMTVSDFVRKCMGLPLATEITALVGRPPARKRKVAATS